MIESQTSRQVDATVGLSSKMGFSLEEFRYSMESKGYFVLPSLIKDQKLLSSLSQAIDSEVDAEKSKRGNQYTDKRFYDIVHHLFDKGPAFVNLLKEGSLTDLADEMVGDTCVVHSYNAVRLAPGRDNNATRIHRDTQRFSRDYVLSVQALIMVDEFREDNGATFLLPGSHNVARKPTDEYFYKHAVRIFGKPGDVVFFNSAVWHCGGENKSNNPRRGITVVYTRSFMKQQFDFVRSLTPEAISNFDERMRRLIGMNVRVPVSEDEFFLPVDQRLYKPNQG